MKLSIEKLEEYSAETGFRTEALEKVIRLGEILADVGRHRLLSRVLVLKGGAALNLCIEAPKRLSVDLDFNYIGSTDRSQMLREKPDIERAVQIIGKGQGYLVQMSGSSHAGRKIYLSYVGKTGTRERIEVDLNFLFRVPLGEPRKIQMWQPGNLARPVAETVSFAELAAGKLCALLDRVTPRDLFDAVRLPNHSPVVWNTLSCRRLFIALGGALKHPLYLYQQERLNRVTDRIVNAQLNPMVTPDAQLPADELKERAWSIVASRVDLDEREREYIEKIHLGEIHAELLFPEDEAMAHRLNQHPVLRWKIDNVRKYLSQK